MTLQRIKNIVHNCCLIFGKVTPATNVPPEVSSYEFAPVDVKIIKCPFYDVTIDDFMGWKELSVSNALEVIRRRSFLFVDFMITNQKCLIRFKRNKFQTPFLKFYTINTRLKF